MSQLCLSQKMALERCRFTVSQLAALFFVSPCTTAFEDECVAMRLVQALDAELEHLENSVKKMPGHDAAQSCETETG